MALKAVSNVLKTVGSRGGKKLATTGGLAFGLDATMNLHGGDDLGTSVLKAGITGALAESNPLLFGGLTIANIGQDVYWGVQQFNHQKKQWWNAQYATNNRVGGNYVDTQRAQTMRQAAVQAIQGSKMNARSALGGEAKILNPYASRRY
ncbi:hypothetical protein PDK03_07035 [Bacillus cereus group sp. TH204-1LC]|uniref:hypothetical protein n=1 Tax=Bacillus cereus group sp. TH204-1LC TaxID=3018054 RepID=UPI0022E0D87B|nr:hypothetical protein [Bacillus cereus group sp. TH204-1LC]MDA1616350.1 hypothetical protein [Bacillus cereus group sp. TH204-1LC]